MCVDAQTHIKPKPQRGGMCVEETSPTNIKPQRGDICIDAQTHIKPKPQRGGMCVEMRISSAFIESLMRPNAVKIPKLTPAIFGTLLCL